LQSLARASCASRPLRVSPHVVVGVATIGALLLAWWLATSGPRLLNPVRSPGVQEAWTAFSRTTWGQGHGDTIAYIVAAELASARSGRDV